MTRRRIWLALALLSLVALVAIGVPLVRGLREASRSDVPMFTVARGDLVRRVHAEGNLEAAEATLLSAPPTIRGPVNIAWLADDGSHVQAGEIVVRFDPTDMEKKLHDGQSERDTVDSRIAQEQIRQGGAIRNLERDASLAVMELEHSREFQSMDPTIFSRVEIIESEIDGTLATQRKEHAESIRGIHEGVSSVELDLLSIERRKAELQVDEARTELQALEVRAPHAGIFTLKEVWGDVPQVGSTIWGGNPVAEIPRMDEMEAKVYVLEADAGGLEAGLSATVTLDAHPDRQFNATVRKVDALAKRRNRRVPVQYFGVTLELEFTDRDVMKPGQRVQAVVTLDELEDVLAIPRQAVFDVDGQLMVYVQKGATFEPVAVELGEQALGRVVVTSGIDEGDRLALRDPTRSLSEPEGNGNGNGNGDNGAPLGPRASR